MMPVVTFGVALVAASSLAVAHGGSALRRTAYVLCLNWLAVVAWATATGTIDQWQWFAIIDAVSAFCILHHPASRPQAVIGVVYLIQITVHFAYALVGHGAATGLYLTMLAAGGWLQIATLAGGAIYGPGRAMAVGRGLGGRGAVPDRADQASVEARP